jgi:transcriptional regulator with GAF, ATPase, and Fis domain
MMKVHENEFFRQATLRVCGDLAIEKAMVSFLQYLQNIMPANRICLELYDEGLSSMRTITMATPSEGNKYDILIPLSEEAKTWLYHSILPNAPDVMIINQPNSNVLACELLHFFEVQSNSVLVMTLVSDSHPLGGVALLAEGTEGFTEEHARLFSLLKEPFSIALSNAVEHLEGVKLKDILTDDNRYLHGELRRLYGDEIIGANFGLKNVIEKVRHVAQLNSPVLLLGETGVGKDVIANAIHYSSPRADCPFVNVNCGAIPETLIDSELFGHEKGAFTGALSMKRGRFERADKGTIFLDEIGELPPQAQVRLLRVLQEKEIERVGGTKTIALDIRIIAATNRNLENMVREHQFREDLWFRLNVFPISIPPLRDRKSDIPALLQHFINLKTKELKLPAIPNLSPGAITPLMEYDWPGNVRELQNLVERALILNPEGPISFENLSNSRPLIIPDISQPIDRPAKLDDVINQHIRNALSFTNGIVHGSRGAAELLGINPSTLRYRMNKLGIDYGRRTKNK